MGLQTKGEIINYVPAFTIPKPSPHWLLEVSRDKDDSPHSPLKVRYVAHTCCEFLCGTKFFTDTYMSYALPALTYQVLSNRWVQIGTTLSLEPLTYLAIRLY
jgi:hypothetical protein